MPVPPRVQDQHPGKGRGREARRAPRDLLAMRPALRARRTRSALLCGKLIFPWSNSRLMGFLGPSRATPDHCGFSETDQSITNALWAPAERERCSPATVHGCRRSRTYAAGMTVRPASILARLFTQLGAGTR